jgi:hypothetical protein
MKDNTNAIFLKSLLYVSWLTSMYTSTFCRNFLKLSIESFRFVEVKFLSSVDGLSHGECVSNRLIMSSDSSDEVFDG